MTLAFELPLKFLFGTCKIIDIWRFQIISNLFYCHLSTTQTGKEKKQLLALFWWRHKKSDRREIQMSLPFQPKQDGQETGHSDWIHYYNIDSCFFPFPFPCKELLNEKFSNLKIIQNLQISMILQLKNTKLRNNFKDGIITKVTNMVTKAMNNCMTLPGTDKVEKKNEK